MGHKLNTHNFICFAGQIVFKEDHLDPRWWYVIEIAPRGKPIYADDVESEMHHGNIGDINGN
eukprot:c14083_g1_i1 orf=152-337(+)